MSGVDALVALRVIQQSFLPTASTAFVQGPHPTADRTIGTRHATTAGVNRVEPLHKATASSNGSASKHAIIGVSAVSAVLGCRVLRRKVIGRRSRQAKVWRRQGPLVQERPTEIVSEVERLQLEAAKLRADVKELEAISMEAERQKQDALFRSWDFDSSGTLDEKELKFGVKQECMVELDDAKARRLLEALDENGDGVLQNEEFSLQRVEKTLQEFQKEERKIEEEARAKARERREQEEKEREKEEYLATLPERNEDDSLQTRLIAALAYLLPLLDAAERFGWPLAAVNPGLFQLLTVPMYLLNAVPFGLGFLLVFFGMQAIAGNPETPALIRFNMRQAIQLDVMLFFPIILGTLARFALNYYEIDLPGLTILASSAVFLAVLACSLYSIVNCLMGSYAKGIPYISEVSELTLNDTRPKSKESKESKDPEKDA